MTTWWAAAVGVMTSVGMALAFMLGLTVGSIPDDDED